MKLFELLNDVPLWRGQELLCREVTSFSRDSRTLQPGALFVAIPGSREDGHRYIRQAMDRGAAAVLCQQPPEEEGPWLCTEDTRLAMALASARWFGRPGDRMTLVAVTGTNGKTTTTNLLKELLERSRGARVGLIGTNRNMVGQEELPASHTTPESFELQRLLRQMADGGCTHVVMEASSHALSQRRLGGLTFEVGIFTNLSRDHLDYHGTMEDYRRAKGLLFHQCRRGVVNLDDEAGRTYLTRSPCPMFTYSERHIQADLTAHNLVLQPRQVEFEAVTLGGIAHVELPIPGGFSVYNALAALSAGLCLGIPLQEGAAALAHVRGVRGRVEVVPVPAPFTVLIDFAHSPNALENILLTARDFTPGRLICLFGCGGNRDRTKRPVMGAVAQTLADEVVLTSDNPRWEDPDAILNEIQAGMEHGTPVHREADRRRAIFLALSLARRGDTVVLAGKGHETEQEIRGTFLPLDERAVVAQWFAGAADWEEKAGKVPADVV